jgi:signal transduction histidine kinase
MFHFKLDTSDILDFSKIEAHKLSLEVIDFNLLSLLEDFADLHALQAAEKQIEFAWSLAPDTPVQLRGDPGRLRQILTNLVGNAVKFTEHGGITLDIDVLEMDQDMVQLRFAVTDTGIGIPADRLDVVFHPFKHADSSTMRKYGGAGLGLAISSQLAEMMGGKIGVDSCVGKGSTFWFTVQLLKPVNYQALGEALAHGSCSGGGEGNDVENVMPAEIALS